MNVSRIIVFLGAPGSGKGTQASKLSFSTKLPHISTGDLFRYHLLEKTPLGKKADFFMREGYLVPDEMVCDMLFDRLKQEDCHQGCILDGFPRTLQQAKLLSDQLQGKKLLVLNLKVSDEELIERLTGRRTCLYCSKIYHVLFHPSKKENICDDCGNSLVQRKDDQLNVVEERLRVYYEKTAPVTEYFQNHVEIISFEGSKDASMLEKEIKEVFQNHSG